MARGFNIRHQRGFTTIAMITFFALYLPIAILVVFAFNAGDRVTISFLVSGSQRSAGSADDSAGVALRFDSAADCHRRRNRRHRLRHAGSHRHDADAALSWPDREICLSERAAHGT